MIQTNTESIRLWTCAAQWTFSQIAVGSLLPYMLANAEADGQMPPIPHWLATFTATKLLKVPGLGKKSVAQFAETNFFDLLDYVTANLMMPLGGLLLALFVGWRISPQSVAAELDIQNLWFFKTCSWLRCCRQRRRNMLLQTMLHSTSG